jgi:hypothetical protein
MRTSNEYRQFEKPVPAVAKAWIDFEAFTARLKPSPFKRIQTNHGPEVGEPIFGETGFCAAYNKVVVNARHQNGPHKHQRHAIYATETSGLLLIALLLLAITLTRYWHVIHWSVR